MDIHKLVQEHDRLTDIMRRAEIPKHQQDVLAPVIDNLSWQRLKLEEAMEEMKDAGITCEYDNGGGQRGTRENPIFRAYISLWKAYMLGLGKLTDYLPEELKEEAAGSTLTVLDEVRKLKAKE